MKEYGHVRIDVLKVDIGRDEYKSLVQAMKDFEKPPVGQPLMNLFYLLEMDGMRVYTDVDTSVIRFV